MSIVPTHVEDDKVSDLNVILKVFTYGLKEKMIYSRQEILSRLNKKGYF